MTRKACVLALVTLIATMIPGCGSGSSGGGSTPPPPPPPPATLTDLTVTPSSASLPVGDVLTFTAEGDFSDGSQHAVSVTWSSADPSVASIDASGQAMGMAQGFTVITAVSVEDPTIEATADLDVTHPSSIFVANSKDGLLRYSWDGTVRTLESYSVAGSPSVGAPNPASLSGIVAVPGGVYLQEKVFNSIWYLDLATNEISLIYEDSTYAYGASWLGLVQDSQGYLYSTVNGNLMRVDPLTGQEDVIATGVDMPGAMIIDANDNIYIQAILASSQVNWVTKYDTSGTATPIANAPASAMPLVGGGLALTETGILYAADGFGNFVYRYEDLDADGLYVSAGEVAACTVGGSFISLWGLFWRGDMLLAIDIHEGAGKVYQLVDSDADGLFLGAGEMTVWSAVPEYNGNTASSFSAPGVSGN